MLGNGDDHRQGRRFATGGNRHDGRDPRDVEIEILHQRVRELEINPFNRYERQYKDTPTDTAVEEYENEGSEFEKKFTSIIRASRLLSNDTDKMKRLMEKKFLPVTHKQDSYMEFHTLKQQTLTIEEFIAEFERVCMRCSVEENEEQTIARFLGSLRTDISDKTTTRFGSSSHTPQPTTGPVRVSPIKADPPALTDVSSTPTTSSLHCFNCQGIGHLKRDCPNKQVLILIDEDDPLYDTEDEVETEVVYPDRAKGKICTVIIDGGSCKNMVSTTMVEKLDGVSITFAPLNPKDAPPDRMLISKTNFVGLVKVSPPSVVFGLLMIEENPVITAAPLSMVPLLNELPVIREIVRLHGVSRSITSDRDDVALPQAEFAYSRSNHSSTSRSPFFTVYGRTPFTPLDLAPMVSDGSVSAEGDVAVRLKLHTQRRFGKLHPRADGPFRILKKINDNAYKVELPGHYGVSDTFNVADLSSYTPNADFDDDSRSSRFLEGEDDTDQGGSPLNPTQARPLESG
nr:reverse transcriptase domain-containing protein [Tanacetum cinerariifolium]